jgi:hypothetical protein
MLVLHSILQILLLQTNLLIGHGLMAENDRVAMSSFRCFGPMTAPIVLIIIFYRNKIPSLVRCGLQNISKSRTFRLLDPASVSRGQLKQKDILFSRETNRHTIICCTYKTGHYCAPQVPSLSPLPIRLLFDCFLLLFATWSTPLSPILLLPALRRSMTTNLGTTRRRRVPRW